MKKSKIKATIIKEESGYSIHAQVMHNFIGTEALSIEELMNEFLEALQLTFQYENNQVTRDDIQITYDLESFFTFYKVINAKALSERIGMNQSLLAQYIKGLKKPSSSQVRRIMKGVQEIGRELCEVRLLG